MFWKEVKDRVEKEIDVNAGDNEDDHTISDSDQLHSPPSSTRVLSFSAKLPTARSKDVYVRQAYIDIYDKHVKDTNFVLVCGNPGVGKSMFLFYVMHRLLKDRPGASIMYEESGSTYKVYLEGDEVQVLKTDELVEVAYYLFDCMSSQHTVNIDIARRTSKTIVVSSPARENFKSFLKHCVNGPFGPGITLYMPMWTWAEVRFCADHLWNVPLETLQRRFDIWGGVPRMLCRMPIEDDAEGLVEQAISTCDPSSVLKLATDPSVGAFDVISHRILHMHVVGDNYCNVSVMFATKKVAQDIFQKLAKESTSSVFKFMEVAVGSSHFAGIYGQIFESFCHYELCSGKEFDVKSLEPGGETKKLSWKCHSHVFKDLDEVDVSMDKYLVPNKRNFVSVDSILPPDSAFQMTVSSTHPVKRHGLTLVKSKLKCDKLNLYFVVPREIYNDFKKQPYHTRKDTCYQKAVTDVSQWAVCVDINPSPPFEQ